MRVADDELLIDAPSLATPAWLTEVLRAAGHDVEVRSVEATPVGTGQMGSSFRLAFEADRGDALPPSFVLKLPAPDPAARAMVAPGYRNEVMFYRHVADTVAVRVPACHLVAASEDWHDFALLLEDLAPAEQGDQLLGCEVGPLVAAAVNLARLHAPRWCDPTLWDVPNVERPEPEGAGFLAAVLDDAIGKFEARIGDRFEPGELALLRELPAALPDHLLGRPERFTPIHGDYRLDNLLFHPAGEVTAVDWQGFAVGLPGRDLAYLISTSVEPDVRRAAERQVVAAYHAELVAHGVADYDLDTCFDDYRFGQFQGPLIQVLGTAYATPTPRGDDMMTAMAHRSLAALADLR